MKPTVVTVTLNPALDKTITIPKLQLGSLHRIDHVRLDLGGKGINAAKVLQTFGVQVTATGLIAGTIGQHLSQKLAEMGIGADFVEVPGETRTNLKLVEEETKVTTELNEPGFAATPEGLHQLGEKLRSLLVDAAVLVIGGSLPPQAPDDIYFQYVKMANECGVKTILDADGAALREGIKAKPFALKPNLFELEQLVGRKLHTQEEIVSAGRSLIDGGVSIVVISMGSRGSIVIDQNRAYQTRPFPIIPASTVGAGDSMVAALAYSLIHNKSTEEIAMWTTTAGTISASKTGTQVCTLAEVTQHLEDTQVITL